jgi:hypothetical protein
MRPRQYLADDLFDPRDESPVILSFCEDFHKVGESGRRDCQHCRPLQFDMVTSLSQEVVSQYIQHDSPKRYRGAEGNDVTEGKVHEGFSLPFLFIL